MTLTICEDEESVLISGFGDGTSLLAGVQEQPLGVFEKIGNPNGDKMPIVPSDGRSRLLNDGGLIHAVSRLKNYPQ